MKNLLEFNRISDSIITCFFYDATSSSLKCFFMIQFVPLTIKYSFTIIDSWMQNGFPIQSSSAHTTDAQVKKTLEP